MQTAGDLPVQFGHKQRQHRQNCLLKGESSLEDGQRLYLHLPVAVVQVGTDRAQKPCAQPYPTLLHVPARGLWSCLGPAVTPFTAWLFRNIQIILSSKKYTWISPGHLGTGSYCHIRRALPSSWIFLKPLRRFCDIHHKSCPANSVPHPANTVFGSCHHVCQGVISL